MSASQSVNFDRAIEFYDQTRGFPEGVAARIPPLFVAAGNLTAQSRVLEIGVGTGRIAVPLAPYVGQYLGVDISTGMMGKLREKDSQGRVNLLQGDATRLPFPDHAFDAVIGVHIFHLIPAWRDALAEVRRVLKPEGALLHGWNNTVHHSKLQALWGVITDTPETRTDYSIIERESFLRDEGWTPNGDLQSYAFEVGSSPQSYLDSLKKRIWSRTWRMSDDELQRAYNVIQAYVDNYYPDPNAITPQEGYFHVQRYLPPQT